MKSKDYIELEKKFGANNYNPLDVVLERGEGVWVWDIEGNKYMDCLSSYSAVNQGHCNPRILEAMKTQASKLAITSRAFRNDQLPLLYEKLHEISGKEMFLLMNSGAEAVETAVKAVRKWGYTKKKVEENKAEIIVCQNNFHGRTTTVISFSSDEQYKDGFGAFTPGFKIIPFGDTQALKDAITPNTVAFLVEPIQAEAGIFLPPKGYLQEVSKICKENNVLLVLDEIQTGLGRTGKMFAAQHEGVEADVITIGKALSGGFYPVSAVLASAEVLGVFKPGDHGSTFGGNPLACAVAKEALNVLIDEKLPEHALEMGEYLVGKLKALNSPKVKEIRGIGLLIGIELTIPARKLCEELQNLGMLCKDTHGTVVRLTPPLIINKEQIDWAVEQIKTALEKVN